MRTRPCRRYRPEFDSAADVFGQQRIGGRFPVELSVRLGFKRCLFSDDVNDDAAGAAIVNGCGTVGPPALA